MLTLHPEMVRACLLTSVIGRAVQRGVVQIGVHDIRDQANDRHRTADDTPYGGGAGMVMKVDVVAAALAALEAPTAHVVMTSPGGKRFEQADAQRLSTLPHVVFLCGHYEGIDARIETLVHEELSLGDFVLTGGEIAASAMVDATVRLLPEALGNEASAVHESFAEGLLEHPQYTRPRVWQGLEVPEILLSGHHGRVEAWRLEQAKRRTQLRRPDLWAAYCERHGIDPERPFGIDADERRQ